MIEKRKTTIKVLPEGTYRFVIEEVFPGSKWKDTCIGEIQFLESDHNKKILQFTGNKFYMDAFKDILVF